MRLSDSQRMLEAAAQRYFDGNPAFNGADSMRKRWTQFADFGWLGGVVSEQKGGYGGATELAILSHRFGAALAPEPWIEAAVFPITFVSSLPGVSAYGDLCQEMIDGTATIVGVPSLPPGKGTLSITRSGDTLKLDGTLCDLVPLEIATKVLVRADGDEGSMVLLVDLKTPGIGRTTADTIDGRTLSRLSFKGVEVSSETMFSPADAVHNALEVANATAVFAQVAQMVGLLECVFTMTQEYLQVRSQFGQVLGSFQALRHRLADMFAELEQARAMLSVGLSALESDDAVTRGGLVSACKLRVCKAARFIGAQAIQLHGAIALTREYKLGAYYKRLLVLEKSAGDPLFHAANFYRRCGHHQ